LRIRWLAEQRIAHAIGQGQVGPYLECVLGIHFPLLLPDHGSEISRRLAEGARIAGQEIGPFLVLVVLAVWSSCRKGEIALVPGRGVFILLIPVIADAELCRMPSHDFGEVVEGIAVIVKVPILSPVRNAGEEREVEYWSYIQR